VEARYLLDTSALYPLVLLLREDVALIAGRLAVLDLTFYEVGNVIWKEHRRGRVRDPAAAARMFQEVLGEMEVLSLRGSLEEVEELAVREGLSFYDASYLYAVRLHGLRLVTENSDLRRYPEALGVQELVNELGLGE